MPAQQVNEFTESDNNGSYWDANHWDWASNERPPVDHIAGGERIPTDPFTGYGDAPGHWDWMYAYGPYDVRTELDPTLTLVARWPSWFFDDVPVPPSPLELALVAQAAATSQVDALIAAIKQDRASKPLDGIPIVGALVARFQSIREVDDRSAALVTAVESLASVTGTLIAELLAAQQIDTLRADAPPDQGG